MMVCSKYKQLYECRLPAQAVRFHQDPASEPESHGYTGPDIPDLLSPLHNNHCLVKVSSFDAYSNRLTTLFSKKKQNKKPLAVH